MIKWQRLEELLALLVSSSILACERAGVSAKVAHMSEVFGALSARVLRLWYLLLALIPLGRRLGMSGMIHLLP